MRRYRVLTTAVLALAAGLLAAGCFGPTVDVPAEKTAIRVVMAGWEAGLEAYNVDQMISPLTSDFLLTIQEGSLAAYSKDRAKLVAELQANEANQKAMRNAGYKIDIKFLEQQVDVAKDGTAGTVKYAFTTDESVGTILDGTIIHEAGTLEASLVKVSGQWKFKTMKLHFNPAK